MGTHLSYRLIPETKGRSLEEMDIIFGAVQEDKRRADIEAQARGTSFALCRYHWSRSRRGSWRSRWRLTHRCAFCLVDSARERGGIFGAVCRAEGLGEVSTLRLGYKDVDVICSLLW